MTHDEMIGRTATAICRRPGSLCAGQCHQEICRDAIKIHGSDARAAIRAIAPAVLEAAAYEWSDDDQEWTGPEVATAIRALKTRYE